MITPIMYHPGTALLNLLRLPLAHVWVGVITLLCSINLSAQVITVAYTGGASSNPPTNGVTGNSAITFSVQNTNATAINLLEVSVYATTAYNNSVYSLWYSATSLGGAATIAAPVWTQVATSGPVPVTAAGNVLVLQNLSMLIPANTTYRFALQSSLGIVYAGTTASPASPNSFTNGGIVVSTGNAANGGNVGYGGAFPSPPNTPRSFAGILNFATPTPCTGTPSALTVSSLPLVCPTQTFSLTLSGIPPGTSGLTYQWQSSTNGTTYTPIAGAVSANHSTTQSQATWYQCEITCANSSLSGVSTPVQVNMNTLFSCYCNSAATNTIDDDIGRVTFGSMANPAIAPSPLTNNATSTATYTNYTSLPPASYLQGNTYPISIQQINSGIFFGCYGKVFIDYNQNGSLTDPGEQVFAAGPTTNTGSGASLLSGTVTIPLSALPGTTLMRVVLRESGNATTTTPCGTYAWGETEDYLVTIVAPAPCAGATAGITTSTLPSVCPTQNFTLAIPNTVIASNIAYQWQSSPNNSTWANIAAGTGLSYTTTQSSANWYRCIVTCTTAGVSDTSVAVQVLMNSILACYCNSAATSTIDDDIGRVTFGALANPAAAPSPLLSNPTATATYTNFTSLPAVSYFQGVSYPISIQQINSGSFFPCFAKVFIDYNQNGVLTDPGEEVFAAGPTTNGGSGANLLSGNVLIPLTALPGTTLMRVVLRESGNATTTTPCGTYTWGETEDYVVNIVAPSGCIGATAGITVSSLPSVCPTQTFTLSMPNTVVASNIVYQWQSSLNNSTWNSVATATGITYATTQSAATWYRCIVTCTNSNVSDTSVAVQVLMNSFLTCYCNSTSTSTADEDIFGVTVNGISNLSTCTSVGPGPGSVQNKYSNYTTIAPFSGALGATVPFSVQIGTCGGNYNNAVKIFIDFNQNGSLSDPGETVYASATATNGPHTESGSFVIPATALIGNLLMRVVNVETSNISTITPCNTYTWGETEDYLINVAAPIPFNGQVSSIYSPSTGCGLSNCEDISFGVRNVGTSPLASIPYSYTINGGAPVLGTFTPGLPVPAGDSASLVIPCAANLATPGTYIIQVTVLIPGDTDPILDSQTKTVISIPTITTFPYQQSFDSPVNPAGGWETGVGAAAGTWALGTPAKSVINSPASSPNSWITNLSGVYNNNEKSWVQSPCLDLSAMVLPVLELSVWWDAEYSWDGMIVQASTDGGATWQNVGSLGTGINWYNDASVSGMTGLGTNQEAWTGSGSNGSGGWVTAKQSIPSLAGQSGVRLRVAFGADPSVNSYNGVAFDDILIYDTPANDVGTSAITAPKGGDCGDDSTAVFVVIINSGLNPQTNFPVTVTYNNGTGSAGSITTTYTGSILPNETDTIFVGTFNSLAGGLFNFVTYTSLPNDGLHINDTTNASVFLNGVPASPQAMDVYKCLPDSFVLGVSPVLAGMHYTWFDSISGGSTLQSGPTFTTPFLSQNTTYYVGVQGDAQLTVQTNLAGSLTTPFPNYSANGLAFTTDYPMTLDSVSIIPTGPGTIQLVVQDLTGLVIGTGVSYSVSVPTGNTSLIRIPVGITLPAGGSYQLLASGSGSTVPNLRYHFNGANYPYTTASVSITGTTSGSATAYFFFYNWKVTTYGCPSLRTPVVAGIYPTPVVNLGPDQSICGGDTLDGGSNWVTTVWSRGNTVLGNSPKVYADTTGTYSLVVTDNNGCVGTDEVLLMVNPLPVVDLGPDTTACGSLLVDAGNPGATFAWTCDAIPTFSQTLTMVVSGNYCVAVTNQFGCQTIDYIGVTIKPLPAVTLGTDIVTCTPATLASLFPIANTTCLWTLPGGQTDTGCVVMAAASGSYLLQMTDTLSGCVGSDDVVVTFQAPPSVNIGGGATDTVCTSKVLSAGNAGSTYLWTTPTGNATTQAITATTTGLYKVAVTNAIGCTGTDSATVMINTTPANLSFSTGYTGKPFEYIFTVGSTQGFGITYDWTFTDGAGNVITATGSSVIIQFPATPDFHEVKVTATNTCGNTSFSDFLFATGLANGLDAAISVYPNPTDGVAYVNIKGLSQDVRLTVYDANGRILMSRTVAQFEQRDALKLDLSEFAKGTYLMRFDTEQGTATRKITLK